MARIFRHRYTSKGVTKRTKKWYVEYTDGTGTRRRVPGHTDKTATMRLAAELERKARDQREGIVDRFDEHRKRPLREHVMDWKRSLARISHHVVAV